MVASCGGADTEGTAAAVVPAPLALQAHNAGADSFATGFIFVATLATFHDATGLLAAARNLLFTGRTAQHGLLLRGPVHVRPALRTRSAAAWKGGDGGLEYAQPEREDVARTTATAVAAAGQPQKADENGVAGMPKRKAEEDVTAGAVEIDSAGRECAQLPPPPPPASPPRLTC